MRGGERGWLFNHVPLCLSVPPSSSAERQREGERGGSREAKAVRSKDQLVWPLNEHKNSTAIKPVESTQPHPTPPTARTPLDAALRRHPTEGTGLVLHLSFQHPSLTSP